MRSDMLGNEDRRREVCRQASHQVAKRVDPAQGSADHEDPIAHVQFLSPAASEAGKCQTFLSPGQHGTLRKINRIDAGVSRAREAQDGSERLLRPCHADLRIAMPHVVGMAKLGAGVETTGVIAIRGPACRLDQLGRERVQKPSTPYRPTRSAVPRSD
jgi:hypothetical protein